MSRPDCQTADCDYLCSVTDRVRMGGETGG